MWSNGQTTDSIYNLSPGLYSVDVFDDNGCVNSGFFSITEPSAISVFETITNVSCNGYNDGSINLNISGGVNNYTVNTAGTSQVLGGGINTFTTSNILSAGTYNYTIIDSNNCSYSNTVTLNEPSPISMIENINHVSCFGNSDGNVSLIISGGIPNYNEDWGNNNPQNLSSGSYNYSITDNNGCTYSDSILINEPSEIFVTSNQNNVSSCGSTDGSIDITVSGGTSPYNYSWSSGQSTQDINSLSADTYVITITDANLCTKLIQ